jgi:hypothetical protein
LSDAIFAGVRDDIKMQTGGDSFAYITLTPEPGIVRFNNLPQIPEGYFLVAITSHGKYPLRQVHATMMDDELRLAAMAEYNKHLNGNFMNVINSTDSEYEIPYLRPQSAEAPSGQVEAIGIHPLTQRDSNRLSIAFSSLNGYWSETLHMGRVNGIWHQCLSVMGPTVKQAKKAFIYCESDWPEGKALAEKDWQFKPAPKRRR